jgi:hypothetical protein
VASPSKIARMIAAAFDVEALEDRQIFDGRP